MRWNRLPRKARQWHSNGVKWEEKPLDIPTKTRYNKYRQVMTMKGKIIRSLKDYDGKPVWVEFENPDACSCANCGACRSSDAEAHLYTSGVYRAEGHFLVAENEKDRFHEFTPRILAIYEWLE